MTTRVVVAMMEHETNTFSPVPTPLERFGRGGFGVPEGAAAYQAFKGTGTGIGGLLDVADAAGWDIVTPIAGNAAPSGKVQADAYNYMSCLLYTSPSPRDATLSRMPSSA